MITLLLVILAIAVTFIGTSTLFTKAIYARAFEIVELEEQAKKDALRASKGYPTQHTNTELELTVQ